MTLFGIASLLTGTTSFVMGLFVYLRGKNKQFNKIWLGVTFSVAAWGYGSFIATTTDAAISMLWWQITYIGVIFVPVFFFHFVCEFLNYNRKILIRIVYALALFFVMVNIGFNSLFLGGVRKTVWNLSWFGPPGVIYNVFYVTLYLLLNLYSYYLLFKKLRIASGLERIQIVYFIIGSGIGWVGSEGCFPIGWNIQFYPLSNFLIALYPIILGYAIVRHQLMEIEVIIKKTLVFAGLLASSLAIIIMPTLIIQEYLVRGANLGGRILGLTVSGIIIILTMRRLETFLINITDKYLFQKKYDYKELLKTFTAEVLTVVNLEKLVNLTVDKLSDIIKLASSAVLLFDDEKQQFNVMASKNIKDSSITLIRPDGIVTFLEQTHGYLLKKELIQKKIFIPEAIQEIIDKLNSELIIPMVLHNEVMGILSLGKKKSDEDYTQDDLDILLPLSRTLAIAISNAKLFEELGKTQAEAAQREKMAVIGTLSAGMAHEIRNPITTIKTFSEFLKEKKDDPEFIKKFEQLITKEVDKIDHIIKNLLDFSKPADTTIIEPVDLKEELSEVLDLLGNQMKLKDIDFVSYVGSIPKISGNRKMVQEVLFNLIQNASHSIDRYGSISVLAEAGDGRVALKIKDTGCGIAEDKLKHIFDPFYTTKSESKGVGLGLFIVRQVMERINARINVASKVGEGTTFTLEFPVAVPQEAKA